MRLCAIVLLIGMIACPGSRNPHAVTEQLSTTLRCGMSRDEVEAAIRKAGASGISAQPHPRLGTHFATRDGMTLWFSFGPEGLTTVAGAAKRRLMDVQEAPKRDLCTGLVTVGLTLETSSNFVGSVVYLDDREVGTIGEWHFLELQVPLGTHQIRVTRTDGTELTRTLAFDAGSDGNPRLRLNGSK